jgi:AraC-like DNA-binding protein
MKTGTEAAQEVIRFRRSPATPGFHMMDADNSAREWRVVSHLFYVVVFDTWRGPISLGGRTQHGAPGFVLCQRPNELTIGRPEGGFPGSFKVLEFTAELLDEWLAERPGATLRPEWSAAIQALSPAASETFAHFFRAFDPLASALQLQAELLRLSEVMVHGLIAGMPARVGRSEGPPIRGTARMRECLHEEGTDIDLETLARKAGLSRFHALRSFKRRYGLPPHAYQIAVRLGQARRLLSEGSAPVEVALRCGFVDQSHFNRHFKRSYGITPLHYARGERPSNGVLLSGSSNDPERIASRSDR